jgi:hypothetical protein
MKVMFAAAFGLALVTVSTASAQRPDRNVEQPVVRSFNWFSYVGGDDIRSACQPGGRNRVRLVYNGLWDEQVRVYDVFLQPDGRSRWRSDEPVARRRRQQRDRAVAYA